MEFNDPNHDVVCELRGILFLPENYNFSCYRLYFATESSLFHIKSKTPASNVYLIATTGNYKILLNAPKKVWEIEFLNMHIRLIEEEQRRYSYLDSLDTKTFERIIHLLKHLYITPMTKSALKK
tara:strand:- start:2405 stop:2776 length:372 start_codon:yes stop_codon:yes gene_type:complete